jgi:hypothetical protein
MSGGLFIWRNESLNQKVSEIIKKNGPGIKRQFCLVDGNSDEKWKYLLF